MKAFIITRFLSQKDIDQLGKEIPIRDNYTPWAIQKGFEKLGVESLIIKLEDLRHSKILPDIAIDCYPPWSDEQLNILLDLESKGVIVINKPLSHRKYLNKWNQAKRLIECNIPLPNTMEMKLPIPNSIKIKEIEDTIGYPMIVKSTVSAFAIGVHKCNNQDEMLDACLQIHSMNSHRGFVKSQSVIAQKWISHESLGIIRVHVAGYKTIGAQQRRPKNKIDFYISNWKEDSIRNQFDINKELADLCESACIALNLELATLDVLHDGNRFLICEINSPGTFMAIDEYVNIDCGLNIARYAISRMEQ